MPNPPISTSGGRQRTDFSVIILPPKPAPAQDLETKSPQPPSGNQDSFASLTDTIEFLEWIKQFAPFVQRIAISLYSWAKGIDQHHLYRIASIRFDSTGGVR